MLIAPNSPISTDPDFDNEIFNASFPSSEQHNVSDNSPCLTCGFVNVNGLYKKSMYPDFNNFINNYDIICLAETKCYDDLTIPGFTVYHKQRSSFINKSGGITIAARNSIAQHITQLQSNSEYALWIKINKRLCQLGDDILLGACYIPPEGSRYANIDAFVEIQNELLPHARDNKTPVILMGDFNAKTATVNEILHMEDLDRTLPLSNILQVRNINFTRVSQDRNRPNNYGHKLLDMCKTTELIILNGRCGEDKHLGATTCNSSSVIDYALVNYGCLDNFHMNFKVHEFSHLLSDVHNHISISLSPMININHLSPSKYPELSDQSPSARETVTNKSKPSVHITHQTVFHTHLIEHKWRVQT
ncbi:zinc-binding alcohol dehydrogenase domain-containing protein 2 [Elysia marginata]|uniref:Zinc-binding alcohol dehydrogenase domain-containing protein 2 n=1 Tax=Elysia marginata TaxID=1093978 RepID=A0AAV4I468_9GAST|nr:zinc-binding alcohol dehydrogenase domain-containing protein 2 [Elysia marginata]